MDKYFLLATVINDYKSFLNNPLAQSCGFPSLVEFYKKLPQLSHTFINPLISNLAQSVDIVSIHIVPTLINDESYCLAIMVYITKSFKKQYIFLGMWRNYGVDISSVFEEIQNKYHFSNANYFILLCNQDLLMETNNDVVMYKRFLKKVFTLFPPITLSHLQKFFSRFAECVGCVNHESLDLINNTKEGKHVISKNGFLVRTSCGKWEQNLFLLKYFHINNKYIRKNISAITPDDWDCIEAVYLNFSSLINTLESFDASNSIAEDCSLLFELMQMGSIPIKETEGLLFEIQEAIRYFALSLGNYCNPSNSFFFAMASFFHPKYSSLKHFNESLKNQILSIINGVVSHDELNQYLTCKDDVNASLTEWWRRNCCTFPKLSQIAKNYIAIQPNESFDSYIQTISNIINQDDYETIHDLLLIRFNTNFIQEHLDLTSTNPPKRKYVDDEIENKINTEICGEPPCKKNTSNVYTQPKQYPTSTNKINSQLYIKTEKDTSFPIDPYGNEHDDYYIPNKSFHYSFEQQEHQQINPTPRNPLPTKQTLGSETPISSLNPFKNPQILNEHLIEKSNSLKQIDDLNIHVPLSNKEINDPNKSNEIQESGSVDLDVLDLN
ncbi:hypothetical protein QTN25_007206 [Entamoeba marina]